MYYTNVTKGKLYGSRVSDHAIVHLCAPKVEMEDYAHTLKNKNIFHSLLYNYIHGTESIWTNYYQC